MAEETALMTRSVTYEANGKEVKLSGNMVREFLVNGDSAKVSDQEITMFLQLCKFQELNPFLKEAYLIKFGDKPAQIITSKEAFMKRAEANSPYQGFKAGIMVQRGEDIKRLDGAIKLPTDKLIGGWAEVYRDDRTNPISVELSMTEFSKGQSTWKTMPMNMIRKTAIVNALREAFPETLGAMYTEDDKNPNDTSRVADVTPNNGVASSIEQQFENAKGNLSKEPQAKVIEGEHIDNGNENESSEVEQGQLL